MFPLTVETAIRLKELLVRSSPLIEEYTAAVCPDCADVCCRQKHGSYRERDILYLAALGLEPPLCDRARPPESSCQFLGSGGCVHPRWFRPFKCTWYFCGPLLAAMNNGPAKKARTLSQTLEELVKLYDELKG